MSQLDHKSSTRGLGSGTRIRKRVSSSQVGRTAHGDNRGRSSGSSAAKPTRRPAQSGKVLGDKLRKLERKIARLEKARNILVQSVKSVEHSTSQRSTAVKPGQPKGSSPTSPTPSAPALMDITEPGLEIIQARPPAAMVLRYKHLAQKVKGEKPLKDRAPRIPKERNCASQTDAPIVKDGQSVAIQVPSTATDVKQRRSLPLTAGQSLVATRLVRDDTDDSSKPVFASQPRRVNIPPRNAGGHSSVSSPQCTLSSVSGKQLERVPVDNDLYGYLIYQFMFYPRTSELFLQMAAKAKLWLKDFDTTSYTHEELHQRVVSAVTAAMVVPQSEVAARRLLQDDTSDKQRHDHAAMVREGNLGSSIIPGFMCFNTKRNLSLPNKPK